MDTKGWFGLPFFGKEPRAEVVSCVLSGGGSRASFQLGALDYLYTHDDGFTPSIIVGTSAGSIVGAVLAQGATREEQHRYLQRLIGIWRGMTVSTDMFSPRPWFQTLEDRGPSWLEIMKPVKPEPPKPRSPLIPFFKQPTEKASPEPPADPPGPLELALTPDEEFHSEWSLAALSGVASHLTKLPKIGTDLNTIALGLENTRSMYRPGRMLAHLLDESTFSPDRVADSGNLLRIAMVSLETGELRYMTETGTFVDRDNQPISDEVHDLPVGVLASCSIPAVFRPVPIGDETFVDGGARENLPAELAIGHLGAQRNYVVSSQSMGVQRRASMAGSDLFAIVMRSMEILIDEAGRDELAYAISAGSDVIYPEISVHDAMVVHPGLIDINMAYGWLRAAERHLALGESRVELHRRIIDLRIRILGLEDRFLALEAPTPRDHMVLRSAKVELRDAVRSARDIPLPPEAGLWWTRWERRAEPPHIEPPWLAPAE